ncbi:MAG: HD domain-containing phosphohydrolase [Oscillospiraceae bacterium]
MTNVPYLYINLIALMCFTLIFVTFLASKKSPAIWAFIIMMLGFMLWTGGSILMRLQVFPGINFWYYVSILALFSLALLIYNFVCCIAHEKGYFLKLIWMIGTILLLVATGLGLILQPPTPQLTDKGYVFTYDMGWPVIIPYAFFALIVISIIKIFRRLISEKGADAPGIKAIIAGCIAVALGNLLQLIPGNVFPWDTLSGIVFAALLIYAMYKKRMFQLTLIVSRTVIFVMSALICVLAASYFVSPVTNFLEEKYYIDASVSTTMVALALALMLCLLYMCLKKLLDVLFTHEEQQGRMLQNFSAVVSQSLDTGEIMESLTEVIMTEISVSAVYVCLKEQNGYTLKYSSEPLGGGDIFIREDSPCVKCLREDEDYLILEEFKKNPMYLSVWSGEKEIFRKRAVSVISALKDGQNVVGLVLMSQKEKSRPFTFTEVSLLETVSSIASIAIKNAELYERMYREARVDSLTGVYNYRFFVEKIDEEFRLHGADGLALIYFDVDDFKLYNQLYGSLEGDRALVSIAEIITMCVGDSGTVFRNSGKVFAALLPGYDGRRTELLAGDIQRRINDINGVSGREHLKRLSVSCGICISPYAASTAKELMENADMAVYNAKSAGKSCINFFKGTEPVIQRVHEKALAIIDASRQSSAYQNNSSTIYALTAAIDAKDHYTYQHSRHVAKYSAILATAAGLNKDQISMIYDAGLLHDIGKISIPESILGKTGKLTEEEYEIIKGHVNGAIDMIRYLPSMDYVIPAALGHHERWDGKGYPRGIKGEEIPVSARCLALADAFDAMTTNRPYRAGFTAEYAASQIEQGAGTQFDPHLAALFVTLVRAGEITIEK